MDTQEMFAALVVFLLAAVLAVLSARSFRQKGFLLNNTWILTPASKRDSRMKRLYYIQSGTVFMLLTLVFAALGIHLITGRLFWRGVSIGIAVGTVIYTIGSFIRIQRKQKAAEVSASDACRNT